MPVAAAASAKLANGRQSWLPYEQHQSQANGNRCIISSSSSHASRHNDGVRQHATLYKAAWSPEGFFSGEEASIPFQIRTHFSFLHHPPARLS
ncbi:hypothetical protein CSOJ01_06236 [Colletotrichum sojae]|uniref:Uncharacterized protein n=1 Tax=Colletotrichum sojae TaxID=2175907 RepID=A0A8H6MVI7_9PEZI|nr:hypothetical protein CSOJ01_06236 [Colletotrichum sojae]